MSYLLVNIRFYILIFSLLSSIIVFFFVKTTIPVDFLQITRLTQIYAFISIGLLYLALLAGPFCYTFKGFPFRAQYLKARRAIGVSAFYFALLHGFFAFFGQLGGFAGFGFLSNKYLFAISLSFTALIILFLMAATSFDFMVEKLTFLKWKFLHRFVYAASLLTLIHALMIGTHFQNLSTITPQIFFSALTLLLFLEAVRFDNFIQKKFIHLPFVFTAIVASGIAIVSYAYRFIIPALILIILIVFAVKKKKNLRS